MTAVTYRLFEPRLSPRRTKLEVPGWSGIAEPRRDGSHRWPMISFVIFKAPPEGRVHVLRPGEPFMQMIFVPAEAQFELVPMDGGETAERELRDRRIHASRETRGERFALDLFDEHRVRRQLSQYAARGASRGEGTRFQLNQL